MAMEKELERLLVRLVGDGSSYNKMMDAAVAKAKTTGNQINKMTSQALAVRGVGRAVVTAPAPAAATGQRDYTKAVKAATAAVVPATAATMAHDKALTTLTTTTGRARDATGRFLKGVGGANSVHAGAGAAVMRHSGFLGSFGAMASAAAGKVTALAGQVTNLGKTLGIAGTLMTLSVTLPIAGAGAAMVKAAADAETTRAQFSVMLGQDQGDKMLANLKEFAMATPFEFPELAASARTLIGFGTAEEDVMKTTKMLGDVSAGTGKDIRELSVVFGQIKAMGRLQGQDMMQLVNAGISYSDVGATVGMNAAQMKDAMEDGLITFEHVEETFRRLTGEGGRFNNMMETLSATATGKFSSLMDVMGQLAAQMGGYLLPTVKNVLDYMIAGVTWFKGLGEEVHKTVMAIMAFAAALGPILTVAGAALVAVGGLTAMAMALGTTLGGLIAVGAGILVTIGSWVVGIVLVIKAFQMLYDHINGEGSFVAALKDAVLAAWNFTMQVVGFIMNIGTNWGLLTGWLKENWFNILKDMGMAYLTYLGNTVKNLGYMIFAMMRLWMLWQGFMSSLWQRVFSAEFIAWVLDGIIKAIEVFIQFKDAAIESLKSIFTGENASGLSTLAGNLATRLSQDFHKGMTTDDFFGDAKTIVTGAMDNMRSPLEGFTSSVTDLPQFATNIGKTAEVAEKKPKKEADKAIKTMAVAEKKKEEKEKKADTESETKTGEFKMMSLKQFAVSPVGLNNPKKREKQEVTDIGVQNKLDALIGTVKGQENTAVMAR